MSVSAPPCVVHATAPILVTGAAGFIGRAVCARLAAQGHGLRPFGRRPVPGHDAAIAGDILTFDRWAEVLRDVHSVIHLAGRAHVLRETHARPLQAFREVNTLATLQLARQAASAGVRRFVFLSTVGVHGSRTPHGRPFTADAPAQPDTPYAVSKHEAEEGLRAIAAASGLELVVIRPPLVHGPRAPGNFGRLVHAVSGRWPLPLAAVTTNRRSLVGVDNLADLVARCVAHPQAAGRNFLVSDDEDVSTAGLLRRLGHAMGRHPRLWPVPVPVLRAAATLLGRPATAQRLLGNLQVDMRATCQALDWRPPWSLDEGLARLSSPPTASRSAFDSARPKTLTGDAGSAKVGLSAGGLDSPAMPPSSPDVAQRDGSSRG